jgi:hypothetical protein
MRSLFSIASMATLIASSAFAGEGARTVDGKPLVLIGAGARKKGDDKLYDITLYVGEQEGKRAFPALVMRAGGRDKARLVRGDHAPAFLVWGHFPKQAVLKFARKVPAAELRADLASAFEADVKGGDDFLALVEDAAPGDEWVLTTRDDGEVSLTIKGELRAGPAGPKTARAIWSIWLGERPLSPELRRALIEHIDVLGEK